MYDPQEETLATLKAKLGISTLSGSNTGDETLATITTKYGRNAMCVVVVDAETDLVAQVAYVAIPSKLNGLSLTRVEGFNITAGVTGNTTIQVRNITKYPSNDALVTPITIPSELLKGAGGQDTSYDDVSTDDMLKITVTGNTTTPAKGLIVMLEYS
jgi:hypothetical protein